MPTVVATDNEVLVPLRVPFWGREGDAVRATIPTLERHLRSRHSRIKKVRIAYRNPRPDATALLHDAWIVILVFSPLGRRLQERLADDAYDWLKDRFGRIKKGHAQDEQGNAAPLTLEADDAPPERTRHLKKMPPPGRARRRPPD